MAEEFVPAEIAHAQLNSFHYLYQDAEQGVRHALLLFSNNQ